MHLFFKSNGNVQQQQQQQQQQQPTPTDADKAAALAIAIKRAEAKAKDKYTIQYVIGFSASLLMVSLSASFAWVSPTIPKLLAPDSPIPITSAEGGWLVLVMMIGRLATVIPGSWLMDRFGRKKTLLGFAVPCITGWILVTLADSIEMLYAARVLWGLSLGAVHSVVLSMYLSEIASDKIRGSLSTLVGSSAKTGIFTVYAIGPHVSIFVLAGIELIPPILFVLIFIWMPESPYYLVGKGKLDAAHKSLCTLRGHTDVAYELDEIKENVKLSNELSGSLRLIFKHRGNRRGLLIVFGLGIGVILTGTEAVLSYSQLIFQKAELNGNLWNPVLGVVLVVTCFVAAYLVERVGRRPLFLISSIGLIIGNVMLTVCFLILNFKWDVPGFSWIGFVGLFVYMVFYGLGLATVTFATMAELIPKNLKALAGTIFGLTISALSLVISKLFQVFTDAWGQYVMFCIFTFFSILFLIFVYFCVPETKGQTRTDILIALNKK